ncbi:MAG TPA: hypothetical protein VMS76_17105 [Planctomycetota bacterium]|nr:hypothetical protein [Planctomycetota bacterium]
MDTRNRLEAGSGAPVALGRRFFRSEVLGWEDPQREGAEQAEAARGLREVQHRTQWLEASAPAGAARDGARRMRTGSIASQP